MRQPVRGRRRDPEPEDDANRRYLGRLMRRNRQAFAGLGLALIISFAALYILPQPKRDLVKGKQAYRADCADCHGLDGAGSASGPNLLTSRLKAPALSDAALARRLRSGLEGQSGHPKVDQPTSLIAYLRALQRAPH